MPERRRLNFESLDQVMPEVDRLRAGYQRLGNWSLGATCEHLAKTLRMATDPATRPAPWLIRATLGPWIFHRLLRADRMPSGIRSPSVLRPATDTSDADGVEALRNALEAFLSAPPETLRHPFFGAIRGEDFCRLQCIHCAHHLGFLIPTAPAVGGVHATAEQATS